MIERLDPTTPEFAMTAMIAHHLRHCLLVLIALLPTVAPAAEPMQEEAPSQPSSLFDTPFDAPVDTPFEVPFDPAFDATPFPDIPAAPAPTSAPVTGTPAAGGAVVNGPLATAQPVDIKPDYVAPAIDAYVDLAFTDSNFSDFGLDETPGGYRLTIGFRLKDVGSGAWNLAPELGYFRAGKAEKDTITIDPLLRAGYITTQTDTFSTDISSLDFGARFSKTLFTRVDGHARAGIGFYHLTNQHKVEYSYTPKPGITEELPPYALPTLSTTDTGIAPFVALGLAVNLTHALQLYAEYGTRLINSNQLNAGAIGLLLDF